MREKGTDKCCYLRRERRKKMARVSEIDVENATQKAKEAIAIHEGKGYELSKVKRILLHHPLSFLVVEDAQYDLDKDLQRLIGKKNANILEYSISAANECIAGITYFTNVLKTQHDIDPATYEFKGREKLLFEYGSKLAHTPKKIDDELFARIKAEFTDEEIVSITAMGVMTVAMNFFNDALEVRPDNK
jgi:hypothetical protein